MKWNHKSKCLSHIFLAVPTAYKFPGKWSDLHHSSDLSYSSDTTNPQPAEPPGSSENICFWICFLPMSLLKPWVPGYCLHKFRLHPVLSKFPAGQETRHSSSLDGSGLEHKHKSEIFKARLMWLWSPSCPLSNWVTLSRWPPLIPEPVEKVSVPDSRATLRIH